jgi:Rrf2 family protein
MAMRHLAAPGGARSASAREIAEQYDIPVELLAKILQKLARGGFLASQQGIHGGYSLARPADRISVADVIETIDGPLTVTACSATDNDCEQYTKCSVRDPLWRIKDRIVKALATSTIAELAAEVATGVAPVTVGLSGRGAGL